MGKTHFIGHAMTALLAMGGLCLSSSLGAEEVMRNTVITSLHLEMQGTPQKNYFYFTGEVQVKGTNLEINCDELTVVSLREGPEGAAIGNIGAIDQIVASGSVVIQQAGRSAFAGLAEVDPVKGTVVLSGKPRIVDNEVEVEGYQFVLHRGEKKFESIPDPNAPKDEPSRSIVRLGAMPDLGFDQEEAKISVDDRISQPAGNEQPVEVGGPDVTAP
ncbi:MAG: LptA/OstA family protein [Opitutales bacterium]|jgi:lipopolysaccharide export system protein LptA